MIGVFVQVNSGSRMAKGCPLGYVIDGNGCWTWVGPLTKGYGRMTVNGRTQAAHRFVWELECGPVPVGMTLDHLCRNRGCVNPSHLEPITDKENILRGVGSPARRARWTHCPKGHPLSGDNLAVQWDGSRMCRACRVQRAAHDWQRKKRRLAEKGSATNG